MTSPCALGVTGIGNIKPPLGSPCVNSIKVTGTHVYCAITATTFMHPCQFLRRLGTKSVLDSNLFRPAYCLKDELPAEAWLP